MLSDGRAPPDKFTFPLVLKACAQLSTLDEVEQIHCMILESQSVPADDVYVTTSLIRMYSQCSRTDEAQRLFDGMPNRNVITWNTMIDGFVKSNDMNSARRLFDEMPDRNVVFWNSLMGGYVRNESPHEALKIFIKLEWDCIAIADLWCVWKERNSRIFRFQANSYIKTIDITCSMLKSWLSQTKLQANIYLLNQIQNSRR
ncbi:putative pentatricopeptide repeat-containing protein [Cocos nucifera]|nr:putative pentatricopeptide repeat-containing protein [Cocos nucifera]